MGIHYLAGRVRRGKSKRHGALREMSGCAYAVANSEGSADVRGGGSSTLGDERVEQSKQMRRETFGLLVRFNVLAFGVPVLAFGLLSLYLWLYDMQLTKAQWKNAILFLWLGGMTCLGWGLYSVIKKR